MVVDEEADVTDADALDEVDCEFVWLRAIRSRFWSR